MALRQALQAPILHEENKLYIITKYNFSMTLKLYIENGIRRKKYIDREKDVAIFELMEKMELILI